MNQPNPIQMQKFLSGVDYPADRDALVEHARSQGADEDVLRGLESMPDRSFDGPNAVSQAFSNQS
ncbi:DUF2795 domain-containing protein [Actinophytocola xanthii]|uniref:DUF2795 domain-containing protein n=1 Tax=Actinophytocola xanthii TaxID=1912961 RepID=A0A1Q8C6K2_9PSEU|nr:DUF2795 domain-containing protein [Actinophytocola xanthii]OLF09996.1 DUF2795 domain-containing protein [Actinophytocola xanthii]